MESDPALSLDARAAAQPFRNKRTLAPFVSALRAAGHAACILPPGRRPPPAPF